MILRLLRVTSYTIERTQMYIYNIYEKAFKYLFKIIQKKNENPNVMWWCKIRAAHKYF